MTSKKKEKVEFEILGEDYLEHLIDKIKYDNTNVDKINKNNIYHNKIGSILSKIKYIKDDDNTNARKNKLNYLKKKEIDNLKQNDSSTIKKLNLFFNKNKNKLLKKYSFKINDDCYIIDNNNKIELDNDIVYFDKDGFYYYIKKSNPKTSIIKESKIKKIYLLYKNNYVLICEIKNNNILIYNSNNLDNKFLFDLEEFKNDNNIYINNFLDEIIKKFNIKKITYNVKPPSSRIEILSSSTKTIHSPSNIIQPTLRHQSPSQNNILYSGLSYLNLYYKIEFDNTSFLFKVDNLYIINPKLNFTNINNIIQYYLQIILLSEYNILLIYYNNNNIKEKFIYIDINKKDNFIKTINHILNYINDNNINKPSLSDYIQHLKFIKDKVKIINNIFEKDEDYIYNDNDNINYNTFVIKKDNIFKYINNNNILSFNYDKELIINDYKENIDTNNINDIDISKLNINRSKKYIELSYIFKENNIIMIYDNIIMFKNVKFNNNNNDMLKSINSEDPTSNKLKYQNAFITDNDINNNIIINRSENPIISTKLFIHSKIRFV